MAVLQPPPWLIHSFIESSFPTNLQDIINPKLLELGTWNFRSMFTLHHVSHVKCQVSGVGVRCHVSDVRCHFFLSFFGQSGGTSRWRVCYQRGLPRLVFTQTVYTTIYQSAPVCTRIYCITVVYTSIDYTTRLYFICQFPAWPVVMGGPCHCYTGYSVLYPVLLD